MNKKGFTLVELIVVIAVLSMVMLIAIPKVNDTIVYAEKEAFKSSAIELGKAAEKLVAISWDDLPKKLSPGEAMLMTFSAINSNALVSNITGISNSSAVIVYNNAGKIEFYVFATSTGNYYCVNGYRIVDIKDNITVASHNYESELSGNHTFSIVGSRLNVS